LAKHLLTLEPDFDFVLIGISSHAKDYRVCWALNNTLNIELKKIESLEIKGNKKRSTPSFFSAFEFEDADNFIEYFVLANLSEGKTYTAKINSLFDEEDAKESRENEFLIPEYKHMNYFFILKGEVSDNRVDDLLAQIKELDVVLTAIIIDVTSLKSKQNLIF